MTLVGNTTEHVRMPPYQVYRNFLDADMHQSLLEWALENESNFEPSEITSGKDPTTKRVSLSIRDFGPTMPDLRQRVLDFVPMLIRDLRVSSFEPSDVELELIASNDGAFFKHHVDTFVGDTRKDYNYTRLVSAVYYFHKQPKGFSGGALRIHPFFPMDDEKTFVDIQPEQNTLVAFPSWAGHEVLPVSCQSKSFSKSRFSVNCWVIQN